MKNISLKHVSFWGTMFVMIGVVFTSMTGDGRPVRPEFFRDQVMTVTLWINLNAWMVTFGLLLPMMIDYWIITSKKRKVFMFLDILLYIGLWVCIFLPAVQPYYFWVYVGSGVFLIYSVILFSLEKDIAPYFYGFLAANGVIYAAMYGFTNIVSSWFNAAGM